MQATAEDRDEAFDWQLKLPHQSVLSFPVTVPLNHPAAPAYYRSVAFMDKNPETFNLFRPPLDEAKTCEMRDIKK